MILIFVISLCLLSLNAISASHGSSLRSLRNATTDSHGFGDSTSLNETESIEESNSNTSYVTSNVAADNDTMGVYWDINNQRGIMKRQNLRFRKIGSKGNIFAAALLSLQIIFRVQ
jgi:hypothetical protein